MNNLILNLYKAFGIRKAKRPNYSVRLHDFVYDKDENPIEEGYDTRMFAPTSGGRTHKVSNARTAMRHAINHVRNTNSPANIYTATGGDAILYAHPKTGLLTLRHVQHSNEENEIFHSIGRKPRLTEVNTEALAARDTAAFNRLKHLHKNSFFTLGDTPMHIDTMDLSYLPAELHTTDEARDMNTGDFTTKWGRRR